MLIFTEDAAHGPARVSTAHFSSQKHTFTHQNNSREGPETDSNNLQNKREEIDQFYNHNYNLKGE